MKAGHKVLDIPRGAGGTLSGHLGSNPGQSISQQSKTFYFCFSTKCLGLSFPAARRTHNLAPPHPKIQLLPAARSGVGVRSLRAGRGSAELVGTGPGTAARAGAQRKGPSHCPEQRTRCVPRVGKITPSHSQIWPLLSEGPQGCH